MLCCCCFVSREGFQCCVVVSRQCAKSICGILEQSFGQVLDSLDLQLASKNNSTLTWAALQLTQLRTSLSTELSASGLNPGSTSHLLAVLYTLSVAAPDVVAGVLAAQCPAINRIVAMVSVVQVTASAADCAGQKWHEWQNLASAIGMDSVYLPAVLSPASKAILIQLHAAAVSQPPAVFRLQVLTLPSFFWHQHMCKETCYLHGHTSAACCSGDGSRPCLANLHATNLLGKPVRTRPCHTNLTHKQLSTYS